MHVKLIAIRSGTVTSRWVSPTSRRKDREVLCSAGQRLRFARLGNADMRRSWSARIIRLFAILNVVLCSFGLWAIIYSFAAAPSGVKVPYDPGQPYLSQMFYLFTAVEFICLVAGLVSAAPLWRLKHGGLLLCNILFAFELLYLLAQAFLALVLPASLGSSVAGAGGIGGLGLAAQYVTAYPLIALIGLNVAYRRLRRAEVKVSP